MTDKEKKVETKAVPAGPLDKLTGNSTKEGALTSNGEPVTETTVTSDEDDD